MNKLTILLAAALFAFVFSCGGKTEKHQPEILDQVELPNQAVTATDSLYSSSSRSTNDMHDKVEYVAVATWIDDFRNFRAAVYNDDVAKLKTYFEFPTSDPGEGLFYLSKLYQQDWQRRNEELKNPNLFYPADLEKYHRKIFDVRFKNCVLKIKTEELYSKHLYRTKLFEETDIIYEMVAEYRSADRRLVLNMAFGNNVKDENGAWISEGEHNVVYTFKVTDGKKLILDRVDIAG